MLSVAVLILLQTCTYLFLAHLIWQVGHHDLALGRDAVFRWSALARLRRPSSLLSSPVRSSFLSSSRLSAVCGISERLFGSFFTGRALIIDQISIAIENKLPFKMPLTRPPRPPVRLRPPRARARPRPPELLRRPLASVPSEVPAAAAFSAEVSGLRAS